MLDDLLGRTELKERIAALEEELTHCQRRLEAEQERRRDAVSDRQDAEERVNRLEDRIADLDGQLSRLRGREDAAAEAGFRRRETCRGDRLRDVLDRLDGVTAPREGALTAMVDDGLPDPVAAALGDRAGLVRRAAPCLVCADDAGLVAAALTPPVAPDPFSEWGNGFRVEREWFLPTGRHAVALVRSDLFAVGVYDGADRLAVQGFESNVKGKHSKGGFSQARFERIRDGQIADHLERCHDLLDDLEREHDLARLFVVGERTVLDEFADRAAVTRAVDATGDPEDALDHAVRDFWTARVYGL